jgi:hypothetical protein
MSPTIFVLIAVGWVAWITPFFGRKQGGGEKAEKVDKRARWGIALVAIAYWTLFIRPSWLTQPAAGRIAGAAVLFALGTALSWTAPPALGRQWRLDAGLNADHQLVRTGPYAIVRHPIYLSMFCMYLGCGLLVAAWWRLAIGAAIFLAGTEIRMRIEDSLLKERFGAEFEEYRQKVSGYLPFIR